MDALLCDLQRFDRLDPIDQFRGPFALLELCHAFTSSELSTNDFVQTFCPGQKWETARKHILHGGKVQQFRDCGGVGVTPLLAVGYHQWRSFDKSQIESVVQCCLSDTKLSQIIKEFARNDDLYRSAYRGSIQASMAAPVSHQVCDFMTPDMLDLADAYNGAINEPVTPGMLDLADVYNGGINGRTTDILLLAQMHRAENLRQIQGRKRIAMF